MQRPEFDNITSYEEFSKYYWYREELIKICKSHGLKAPSGKIELNKVIEAYFSGEKILPDAKQRAGKKILPDNNDNSTAKLFRKGRFTVLSLGDLMSSELADDIASSTIARQETDVMLVAHHGADNGFTTAGFLNRIVPKVGICCSEWGNQYEHPDDKVIDLFKKMRIPFYNTKAGDVVCLCDDDNNVHVYNLCSDNNRIQNEVWFRPKMTF